MNSPSQFFALSSGFFMPLVHYSMPYILEGFGGSFRKYSKNGATEEWSGEGDEGFECLVKKAINDGLYKEIEFPSSFSSRGLSLATF